MYELFSFIFTSSKLLADAIIQFHESTYKMIWLDYTGSQLLLVQIHLKKDFIFIKIMKTKSGVSFVDKLLLLKIFSLDDF